MRFGITAKLFFAILATNIVMAVAFGVAVDVSLRHGFREYVKEREQRRMTALSQLLAAEYAGRGNWQFLQGDPDRWTALLRQSAPEFPGRFDGRFEGRRGPPPSHGPSPGQRRDGPGPGRMIDLVTLEDANRQHIAGESVAKGDILIEQPVTSNGIVVGWLKLPGPTRMGPDSRFLEEVLKTSWIVAGLALLLAAIVALPLARRFISPIRRLAGATQRLSSGDFTERVEVASDDELGQLTRDFNSLAATLARAEEARRGFIADVSHELRTPLAILKGEVDALRDGITSPTPDAIESLRAEVTTLERLVHELYDLAVSDLGQAVYHFEDVDLASLAGDAADTFRDRMASRGLTLEATAIPAQPLVAKAEARRIMQLFTNLLENSLRYTDSGGRVVLRLREEGSEAVIDVMDTAPGVPEALRPRLFERLFRVEPSRSREFGGAGLGLALCRSIVRAHGGNIGAKESPLGGLWIEIRLPLSGPGPTT